jgi:hypothetical protein
MTATERRCAQAQEHMRRSVGTSAGMHLANWLRSLARLKAKLTPSARDERSTGA